MNASVIAGPWPEHSSPPLSVQVATCLSAAAALAHAVVTPEHFSQWTAAGVFFAAIAIVQGWGAVMLHRMRMTTAKLSFALWANVGVIVVYVVSRTSGLPFGPAHAGAHHAPSSGRRELVGPLDALTLVVQIALVVLLIAFLPPRTSRRTTTGVMLVGAGLWLSSAVGLLS